MRPRIVLEEKGVPWVSHHLDLTKGETHTPEYFGIKSQRSGPHAGS